MNDVVLRIEGLYKSFGDLKVIENLNLEIKKAEKIAIIGGSGCGKSVLLRSMELLIKPDKGKIFIYDDEITKKDAQIDLIRRKMGMVYQQFNLFSHMNVMDNLCLAPTKLLKMDRNLAEEKARTLLREVGLSGREKAMPKTMSGGQQQRVAIARCLMMDPQIMFFDEPTSALDPTMVGEVLATIRALGKRGMTMVIVTHEMNFAKDYADRVLFLADHGIYEEGTPDEIFNHPKREKTIDFINKLKYFEYHIDNKIYDLMAMQGGIISFCERYGIEDLKSWRTLLFAEELIEELLPNLDNNIDINISVEYSELEKVLSLKVDWAGKNIDLLSNDDNLGVSIVKHATKSCKQEVKEGRNILSIYF